MRRFELHSSNTKSIMDGTDLILSSDNLKDIWLHIKFYINIPRNYYVEQINDDLIEATLNAIHLSENFKTEKELPMLLTDLEIFK